MTDHTADNIPSTGPASELEPVTDAQLAAEPRVAVLDALRRGADDLEGLARRIEVAADAELARRGAASPPVRPRLVLVSTGTRRAGARADRREELAPLFARALRPAMFAAAAATLLAVGLARWGGTSAATATGQELSDASAVQALSLHDPSAQWPDQARAPSVDALGRAIGLGGAP